jgi:hypothetical protein
MKLQLKIQLKHISKPPIWRRILVPSFFTFDDLHLAIQFSFGWDNCHLYMFNPSGWGSHPTIQEPNPDMSNDHLDSNEVTIVEILQAEGQKFTYIYDFGDSWEHSILVEKFHIDLKDERVIILGGKSKCPPEDCGGPWGYETLKEALSDKKHPEHQSYKDWLGLDKKEKWDDAEFDLEETQEILDEVFE